MDIKALVGDDINKCTYNPCRWHTKKVNDSFCPKHRKIMEAFETGTQEEKDLIRKWSKKSKCEVCGEFTDCCVIAVPGVPFSCRYCVECLEANAHPWGILVANTVCAGGYDKMIDEWHYMVADTCARLGKTLDEFLEDVTKMDKAMNEELRRMEESDARRKSNKS